MSQEPSPSVAALFKLSWPAIVVFVAFSIRQGLDVWMVGALGEAELAAIAGGVYIFYLPQTFGMGLLVSVNTLAAQNFGRGLFFESQRIFFQGAFLAVLLGTAFLTLVPLAPGIFALSGHDAAVQSAETVYLQWVLFALTPQFIVAAANNYLFAVGKPKVAMVVSLGALVLNGLFNYAFIFGKLGAPALGIAGAALGTILAVTIQAVVLATLIFRSGRKSARKPPRLWFYLPSRRRLRRLIRIGLPAGLHECVEVALWSVALIFLIGQFGTAHLAAAALLLTFMDILYAPTEGIGGALTALVGRDIGSGRHGVAQKWTRIGLKITVPFMIITGLLCLLLREPLIAVFTDSKDVMAVAQQTFFLLPVILLSFALIVVYDYALVGAGDTIWPAIAHLIANLVFLIGGGIAVVVWFPTLGSMGVWSMATIGLVFVAGAFLLRWRSGIWKNIDLLDDDDELSKI